MQESSNFVPPTPILTRLMDLKIWKKNYTSMFLLNYPNSLRLKQIQDLKSFQAQSYLAILYRANISFHHYRHCNGQIYRISDDYQCTDDFGRKNQWPSSNLWKSNNDNFKLNNKNQFSKKNKLFWNAVNLPWSVEEGVIAFPKLWESENENAAYDIASFEFTLKIPRKEMYKPEFMLVTCSTFSS